jgi:hypothetical protein
LIAARELAMMKPSALVVNTARGAVVEKTAAEATHLAHGQTRRAADEETRRRQHRHFFPGQRLRGAGEFRHLQRHQVPHPRLDQVLGAGLGTFRHSREHDLSRLYLHVDINPPDLL